MASIIAGTDSTFTVSVQTDGRPVPLSGSVTARVMTMDARTTVVPQFNLDENGEGADWPDGVAAVTLTGAQTAALEPREHMLVLQGGFGIKRFSLRVETLTVPTRNSLFVRDLVVDEIRRDRIMAAATSLLAGIEVSDDYIWDKVRAAESEVAHTLRVPLVPTKFFPIKPTQAQIDALEGMAWAVDPAYDYHPDMFHFEKWGYFIARQRPIISVESLRFAYPSQESGFFDIPLDWIRIDAKYGHVRLVPSSPAVFATMDAFIMTALASSRSIPFMIQLSYTAGLEDVDQNYPELPDIVKRLAVLKIVSDTFLPQSGSISADGLSQSISVDMDKYQEAIDAALNGPPGANGGLVAKLHGIRTLVI